MTRIPRGLKNQMRGEATGYMQITSEDLSIPIKFYKGNDGKIHAQATSRDANYGLTFKDEAAMRQAFITGVTLERVPMRTDLEEKYGAFGLPSLGLRQAYGASGTPDEVIGSRAHAIITVNDNLTNKMREDIRTNNEFYNIRSIRFHDETAESFLVSYGSIRSGKVYTEHWKRETLPDQRYVWRRKVVTTSGGN